MATKAHRCPTCRITVHGARQYLQHKRQCRRATMAPARQTHTFRICNRCPRQPDGKATVIPSSEYAAHLEGHKAATGQSRHRTRAFRELRSQALARQGYRCAGCGRPIGQVPFDCEAHHINGLAGDDRLENIEMLCCGPGSCHARLTADFRGGS